MGILGFLREILGQDPDFGAFPGIPWDSIPSSPLLPFPTKAWIFTFIPLIPLELCFHLDFPSQASGLGLGWRIPGDPFPYFVKIPWNHLPKPIPNKELPKSHRSCSIGTFQINKIPRKTGKGKG